MNQEQIDAFLEAPRHAIVAPLRVEGAPQLSPVWYLYEEGRLYFSIWVESAKYRQLSRDSRVTVCVDAGHPDARFVTLYGTAELIDEESHWRENLEWRIVRRYHQSDEEARRWQDENSGPGRSSLVVVSPERIIGRDFN
jgi:PPOX class probable F420-dependent enzyme